MGDDYQMNSYTPGICPLCKIRRGRPQHHSHTLDSWMPLSIKAVGNASVNSIYLFIQNIIF